MTRRSNVLRGPNWADLGDRITSFLQRIAQQYNGIRNGNWNSIRSTMVSHFTHRKDNAIRFKQETCSHVLINSHRGVSITRSSCSGRISPRDGSVGASSVVSTRPMCCRVSTLGSLENAHTISSSSWATDKNAPNPVPKI